MIEIVVKVSHVDCSRQLRSGVVRCRRSSSMDLSDDNQQSITSDNIEHETNTDGYSRLSQDAREDSDDDDDDEFHRFVMQRVRTTTSTVDNRVSTSSNDAALWTRRLENETFTIDDDQAARIKTLMSSVQMAASSVPIWTRYYSEHDWQEKLRERIACRETTLFSHETRSSSATMQN
jgi:hypothetical protein